MSKENGSTLFQINNHNPKDAKVKLKEIEANIKSQKSAVEDLEKQLKEAKEKLEKSQDQKIQLLMIIKGKSREDIIKYLSESKNTIEELEDLTLTDSKKKTLTNLANEAFSLTQTIIDKKENVPFATMIKDSIAEKADQNKKFVSNLLGLLAKEELPKEKTISELEKELGDIQTSAKEVIETFPKVEEPKPEVSVSAKPETSGAGTGEAVSKEDDVSVTEKKETEVVPVEAPVETKPEETKPEEIKSEESEATKPEEADSVKTEETVSTTVTDSMDEKPSEDAPTADSEEPKQNKIL